LTPDWFHPREKARIQRMQTHFAIQTTGPGLYEFTRQAVNFVANAGVESGLLTLFVRHTSCSLLIQENADPDVKRDLDAFFSRLVPRAGDPSMAYLLHRLEGDDDMPAHIKAALTQTSISIPVADKRPALGTWQGIYLFEHRDRPHDREIIVHLGP
jgi:secondary thiamine-phosphate synthase enzyme